MSETITEAAPEVADAVDPAPAADTPAETTAAPDAPAETPADPPAEPEQQDPLDKRIAREVRAKHEARREAARLSEEVARLTALVERAVKPETDEPRTPLPEAEIERRAAAKAAEITTQREFDAACDKVFDDGTKAHKDFGDAVRNLNASLGDMIQKRPDFLAGIAALPNGHEVYYKLANDVEGAERVLRMAPVQLGIELAKRSAAVAAPKPVSRAPAPIAAPSGSSEPGVDIYDPKMPMDKFSENFLKTYRKRR